jgi:hypothetical protein
MVQHWVEGDGSMLGQRVGSRLSRREWFESGLQRMVHWWLKGVGSMVVQNDGCLVGAPNKLCAKNNLT